MEVRWKLFDHQNIQRCTFSFAFREYLMALSLRKPSLLMVASSLSICKGVERSLLLSLSVRLRLLRQRRFLVESSVSKEPWYTLKEDSVRDLILLYIFFFEKMSTLSLLWICSTILSWVTKWVLVRILRITPAKHASQQSIKRWEVSHRLHQGGKNSPPQRDSRDPDQANQQDRLCGQIWRASSAPDCA